MKRITPLPLYGYGLFLLAATFTFGLACTHFPSTHERMARDIATNYMFKDYALLNQFAITERGLEVFALDTANPARKPEAVIHWEEVDLFRKMIAHLPVDSLLFHFQQKGEKRWHEGTFSHLPELDPPFVIVDKNAEKPLLGMRIALDPGHVGGQMDYAQHLEEKYVLIRPDEEAGIGEEISFCEGNLALGTAKVLAEELRKLGATVMLTREIEGMDAFGSTFEKWMEQEVKRNEKWLKDHWQLLNPSNQAAWPVKCAAANYIRDYALESKDAQWWMNKANLANIHRVPYLKAEFIERARKINDFKPHVTFIIHYNVGANNDASSDGYRKAVPENYCMAFVPGAFMRGELKEPKDRLEFAAKILTDDIPTSVRLSGYVVRAHEKILGVPAMTWDDRLWYLKNASLLTPEKGVFARNLQLTRLIHGTLCFGESLYQDNLQEAKLLNAKNFVLPGMTTPMPDRIRDVANAYKQGLMDWLESK